MTKIVEYIETDELRGNGTPENVYRRIQQLWTKDGVLIAEYDPLGGSWFYVRHEPKQAEKTDI